MLGKGFVIKKLDLALFILHKNSDSLIIQIYADDIIFGPTNDSLCRDFVKDMKVTFEMSMIGVLKSF